MPRLHLGALALFAFGIVSISLLVWTNQLSKSSDEHLRLADALMDLQIYVASSHFRLEEGYHKEMPGRTEKALSDLNRAVMLSNAVLNGGHTESGLNLKPLKTPALRKPAQKIAEALAEMKVIAVQMSRSPQNEVPLAVDERYDSVCDSLLRTAKSLELSVEQMEEDERVDSRRLLYAIFLTWSGVVAAATFALRKREKQRQWAEAALLDLNTRLERQTKELSEHKAHLMDLVEQRTAVLKISNDELREEISERRQIEEALRKSEEKYRMLVETMNDGLTILDPKEVMTYANEKFCQMLDRSRDQLLGQPLAEFLASNKDRGVFSEQLQKVRLYDHSDFEVAFRAKNGHVVTRVSLKQMPDTSDNTAGCFAVITDITEKITLQAMSMRAATLAYLGEIAAGVAHEINNPINGIINYAQLLYDKSHIEKHEREIAARIQREGWRIADIVKGLLLSARGGNREKIAIGFGEVISRALGLIGTELRKDEIDVRLTVPSGLPEMFADPQEMQQVFINILSNARYALNEKYPGKHDNKILQIRAEQADIDQLPWIRITFRDHGTGVPAEIIDKVKQPFFSTKPKGKGTGLGLSISNGIINGNGGRLAIRSTAGEYTEIAIDMPAFEKEEESSAAGRR